jgi:hypothetical protein
MDSVRRATLSAPVLDSVVSEHYDRLFDFHVGHNGRFANKTNIIVDCSAIHGNVPESKGGATEIANLRPICSRCNLSMGSQYSITEWAALSRPRWWCLAWGKKI